MGKIIVSLTSYPGRIRTISQVLDSIIKQTVLPDKIILYLSSQEFKGFNAMPDLKRYAEYGFEIHWCEENLKSHKKWFYVFQEYPDEVIITVDDDFVYQDTMVETLLKYHERFPRCVIARNAKLITCDEKGAVAPYERWCHWGGAYIGVPRMDLIAIGNAGILYPQGFCSNAELYCKEKFMEMCPYADDIWLKIMEVYSGIPVVLAGRYWDDIVLIEHQKSCLYKEYNKDGGNDKQVESLLRKYPVTRQKKKLVECIFGEGRTSYREIEAMESKEMEKILVELRKKLESQGKILVYGAGEMGTRIFYLLGESAVEIIKAFIVNKLSENITMIENIPVRDYRDYIDSNEKIVIALCDNEKADKVRQELIKNRVSAERVFMLKEHEKEAVMKKVQIPFFSGKYWQKRYRMGGNSGDGSYGRLAEFKAEVINKFVKEYGIREVVEWGCGDGNQLKLAEYPVYTGYDVSEESIAICKRIFADDSTKKFFCCGGDGFNGICKGELAISLDVIYHLVEDEIYEQYMNRLFFSSEKYVCIYSSNYENQGAEHVRHREFSKWIDENESGCWRLLKIIYNRYPYSEDSVRDTSWSDFYFYERVSR